MFLLPSFGISSISCERDAMAKSRLNVVIVNYKTPLLTKKCVDSLLEYSICSANEIIVVDNASTDDSAQLIKNSCPGVNLCVSEFNGGFGAGVNLGFSFSDSDYVLVLNPDTYFIDYSFKLVIEFLKLNPKVGIVGLNLIYPDGSSQYSARRFYSFLDIVGRRTFLGKFWPLKSKIQRHLMKIEWATNEAFSADWVMGTGFVIRKSVFDKLQGMDEGYFLYMEDVDLCKRVWDAGYQVFALPRAMLVHDHQRSSSAGPLSWAGRQHINSLLRYYKKFSIPFF